MACLFAIIKERSRLKFRADYSVSISPRLLLLSLSTGTTPKGGAGSGRGSSWRERGADHSFWLMHMVTNHLLEVKTSYSLTPLYMLHGNSFIFEDGMMYFGVLEGDHNCSHSGIGRMNFWPLKKHLTRIFYASHSVSTW